MWKGVRFLTWGWSWLSGSWFWDGGVGAGGATPREAVWVLRWQHKFTVLELYFYLKGFNSQMLFFSSEILLYLCYFTIFWGFVHFLATIWPFHLKAGLKEGSPSVGMHEVRPSCQLFIKVLPAQNQLTPKLNISAFIYCFPVMFGYWKTFFSYEKAAGTHWAMRVARVLWVSDQRQKSDGHRQHSFCPIQLPSSSRSHSPWSQTPLHLKVIADYRFTRKNFKICIYSFQNISTATTC